MRRLFAVICLIAVLSALGLVMSGPVANAQGGPGITYLSGVQLQNLAVTPATISIVYYNQNGTVATTVNDTIPGSGSKNYFPVAPAAPFNGSAVVSSDQQLVAIVNQLAGGAVVGGSAAGGFSAGATKINLPLIMRGNSGFNTWFNVQNAGPTPATVQVSYVPGSFGSAFTETVLVQPGASQTFDQIGNASLGVKFIGAAVVTANQPVVATVEQVGSGTQKAVLGYNGFASGSTSVALPLVMANNSGYFTGIQVQNVGNSPTIATVTYSPNIVAGMGTPVPESAPIQPGQSATFIQATGQWTGRYVGAATVTTNNGQSIVAIVNQLKTGTPTLGSAYEGFNPATATSKISTPLIMTMNSNYFTTIQVQNVGASSCPVVVTYSANTVAGMGTPTPDNVNIAAGTSQTVWQFGGQWNARYIGSAVVSGTGCSLLAIVNEINVVTTANDQLFTYTGTNY